MAQQAAAKAEKVTGDAGYTVATVIASEAKQSRTEMLIWIASKLAFGELGSLKIPNSHAILATSPLAMT
jgi:hypothetical protein